MRMVFGFAEINLSDLPRVGGKNASLGEMISKLSVLGVKVPDGFATSVDAYKTFMKENNLEDKINLVLKDIRVNDIPALKKSSRKIKNFIMAAPFSKKFEAEIRRAYQQLHSSLDHPVAVRSSATVEDLPEASFAGLQESYLNIVGVDAILKAIKQVYASLFTERAIAYRVHQKIDHANAGISVGIQKMVRGDLASSGVIFTLDTESGFDQVIFITASYGLGECIVQGAVNPDEFYVHKPTLNVGKKSIISRKLGSKKIKMVYAGSGNQGLQTIKVDNEDQQRFCLTDEGIIQLSKLAMIIERHYGTPMDIEWAQDGLDKTFYILQARPETVKTQKSHQVIEQYHLTEKVNPIVTGRSVGQKIGQGVARKIHSSEEMHFLKTGEILVADMTDPDWEPIMKRAAAIVTNRGGRTCHAAIVARELGIPAVVGCGNATQLIKDGTQVTVSCAEGEAGYVYAGKIPFRIEKTTIETLPNLPLKLCMNLANPEQAFTYQFIPHNGIGLARLEFIIGNMIGIHPNAILQPEKLSSQERKQIKKITIAYSTPSEFYIEKLAEGIATISAAFYPKPVIVRFSDFKSNEYASLLGGKIFEPQEENPMIGYRGASRYISGAFQACFDLECEAIKRVREKKGLINTQVMFPFVRTPEELQQLLILLKQNGLERGKEELQVYMMCEVPSNAILAEEFLQHVDGYSIGSNDLTQLMLGLDRDSELVAHLFDERNAAVKAVLRHAIGTAKKLGKYIGICGQGPSDHIDFAKWLMEEGVDTLSLSPDSVVRTWLALGKLEKM